MKKKMLLITHGFPFGESEQGFLGTEFAELSKSFEVTVLPYRKEKKRPVSAGMFLTCFRREIWEEIREAKTWNLFLFFGRAARILLCSFLAEQVGKEIRTLVESHKIEMIYTYWGTEEAVAALRLKEIKKDLKVIIRFHGYDLYNERTSIAWQTLQRFKADGCDRLVFVCNTGKRYFNQVWGGEEKSIVSFLGTPSMQRVFPEQQDRLILVSCSNLIKLKRVELIIKALSVLPEKQKVFWHHIGDGKEGKKLRKLAGRLFLRKPNIKWKFWGQVPHQEIGGLYQKIKPHLFITTSSTEGIPVSVQEAFSMGVPAVGTDVGGMRELIINSQTGFLLHSNPSAQEVAQAVETFSRLTEKERQALSDGAYKAWNRRFDAQANAQKFVQMLKEI